MASLLAAAQLSAGVNTPIRHSNSGKQLPPPCENSQLRIPGPMRQDGATRRRGVLDRREMMVASGAAALLSFGAAAEAAHAAAGEIETAEEAAANPLIQTGEIETAEVAATNPLIQELLASSRANKAAYDAARLQDYYKRNFKEYFDFVEGSVRNKKELTPAERDIVEWLAKNR